jgi:cyclic lactone autoinducer peptide
MKNELIKKAAVPVAKLIKKMAVIGANTASIFGTCQPKEPAEMKKFKK